MSLKTQSAGCSTTRVYREGALVRRTEDLTRTISPQGEAIHFSIELVSTTDSQRRIRTFRATGETRHVPEAPGSWDLRYPLPKTEKSADLAHYFSGVAKFCAQNKETSNLKGSLSGLNRIYTGEIHQ